ncbi:tripartite-type tricarboxylate transporter receptor subunit TctC [Blastococcus colisei]|uniref:Tripartite-type tricarboxylate transporter receptor subunit TctC n=1 Tax=Blastococcus colisei TaxID=1564162 RepID=A0A543P242_9ACTN|nr:tripartite tricarboxylate transporter substrate binding protein [Blastococcus colisei]TQN38020.1 tripartite-type tricarboxylate transporter receptor subunit TctC [Blastococcus colisei]
MTRVRVSAVATAAALVLAGCGGGGDTGSGGDSGAQAVDYPTRDISYIVPYGTGGSTDPIGRQYSSLMEELLGATIVVENREGGGATIGTSAVVTAQPDGHTLGLSSNSALTNQPITQPDLPYDTPEDYQPIIKLADLPTVVTVAADAPWQSIEEFVQYAEDNPGQLRVSVSGARTAPDLSVQELNRIADVEITTVPFSGGGGEALAALLGGQVEANAGYAPSVRGQVEAGELRVLGVFYDGTYDVFPEAESFPEAGYDVTLPATYYTIAPAGLPADVLDRLVEASEEALASEEFLSFAEENGYIVDPITTDDIRAELEDYRETYEALYEFLGD